MDSTHRARVLGLALLVGLLPVAGFAQDGYRYELTPTLSYRFGGSLDGREAELFDADLETDDGAAFGVTFDIPLSRHVQLELLASRQSTDLRFERGLFGVGGSVADVDVTYYHVGVLWQWGDTRVSPFVVASAGVANLDPDLPGASSEDRFSISVGGGVKVFLSENVGLRFEGRGFVSDVDGGGDGRRHDRYCYDYDGCYDDDFSQGQASVGLIFTW